MDLQSYFDEFTARDWETLDSETEPLRIAMVGLGWWVKAEAMPAVEESDFCETTVVVSRDQETAEEYAEDEGLVAGISAEQFHDGVATDEYDAVYVCTPNATHLPYVESAAQHGKAVLCEKPMEASVERAQRMVEVAADAEITLMVAYRMQTEPAVRRLRDLIADGLLGKPRQIHGHMSQPLLEEIPNPEQWRLDPDLAGPGATVTDIGVYPLNTARFILEADPIAVQASLHSESDEFDDVPDEHAAFTMEFADGVTASCTASQNASRKSFLTVVGTEGSARLDPAFFPVMSRELEVSREGTTIRTTFDQQNQMTEEFDYFADCIKGDRRPIPDGEHGLFDMRVIESVYEAADGERVEIRDG